MIYRRSRRLVIALLACLHAGFAAFAQTDGNAADALPVAEALARYEDIEARRLPSLSGNDLAMLEAGDVVVVTDEPSRGRATEDIDTIGVVGLQVIDVPRMLVWLSVLGHTGDPPERLTRATLAEPSNGSRIRYQHIDLPWPLRDRHWVIRSEKNIKLAERTDGLIWEHRWSLAEDGIAMLARAREDGRLVNPSSRALERSIYLSANDGAWTVFALSDSRTLVVLRMAVGLGGYFPAQLVRAFAQHHTRKGLQALDQLSSNVQDSYVAAPVVYDGFGRPISM